ncbi:copper transporter [Sphaerisporangium fuscum]|uniref:copper transporter n=1 Tax=Sphaerisporangium fuscum TaxID=2835868 RepID=UPI001BDCF62A|nr:copper transporter [Sphaerisporangium fuscum]
MIDFRYHIVSIVAIFLALAIGIVLGSTVLNAPLVASTEKVAAGLRQSNAKLLNELSVAQTRGDAGDTFIADRLPQLVQGALTGERVVVVEAPGADTKLREPLQQVLAAAGAVVSGRVTLTEKFIGAEQAATLDQLATTAKPASMTFPAAATAYDKAAAVLAAAVLTPDKAQAGKADPAAPDALAAFEKDGLLSVEGDPGKRATLALLMAPAAAYEGKDADSQTAAIVSLASGLDGGGEGAVVAGVVPTSATAGLIAAVRADSDVALKVSSVDNADMASGKAVVVYALREQVAGDAGQYGLGSDATALEPTPTAVTPSPTPDGSSGG